MDNSWVETAAMYYVIAIWICLITVFLIVIVVLVISIYQCSGLQCKRRGYHAYPKYGFVGYCEVCKGKESLLELKKAADKLKKENTP